MFVRYVEVCNGVLCCVFHALGPELPSQVMLQLFRPVTAAIRSELRATVASLLIGLFTAQDYEGEHLHLLMDWFASQVGESQESVSLFAEPHGVQNKIGLRILLRARLLLHCRTEIR